MLLNDCRCFVRSLTSWRCVVGFSTATCGGIGMFTCTLNYFNWSILKYGVRLWPFSHFETLFTIIILLDRHLDCLTWHFKVIRADSLMFCTMATLLNLLLLTFLIKISFSLLVFRFFLILFFFFTFRFSFLFLNRDSAWFFKSTLLLDLIHWLRFIYHVRTLTIFIVHVCLILIIIRLLLIIGWHCIPVVKWLHLWITSQILVLLTLLTTSRILFLHNHFKHFKLIILKLSHCCHLLLIHSLRLMHHTLVVMPMIIFSIFNFNFYWFLNIDRLLYTSLWVW